MSSLLRVLRPSKASTRLPPPCNALSSRTRLPLLASRSIATYDQPPTDPETVTRNVLGEKLTGLMDSVSQKYDYNKNSGSASSFAYNSNSIIRPIDLQREFHMRRSRERRPAVGPGREARRTDIFLQLGIDPRLEVDNINLLTDYMSHLGKILPRSRTRLTHRSQRFLGKAIKRSKAFGFLPILSNPRYRDPELSR